MPTTYQRLEQDTSAARAKFMNIPVVRMLLEANSDSTMSSPEAFESMKALYARFLKESYYHVRAAARVYALAGSRVGEDNEPVREWLLKHAVEEYGHHDWVLEDLRALGHDPSDLGITKPSVPSDALVAWMYYIAGVHNPVAVLADSYVIEGLSQLFASQLADAMKEMLSVSDQAVTYLARHGVADQGHMDDLRDLINTNVTKEQDYLDMVQCAKVEFELYGQILRVISEGMFALSVDDEAEHLAQAS